MSPVSVIIPAHQAAKTIGAAVHSAAAQRPAPEEIIVVDDGSTDGTAEVAGALPGVHVLRHDRPAGPSAARNRAAGQARGELLAFLDADDTWLPGKLDRQLRALDRHPRAVAAAGDWVRGPELAPELAADPPARLLGYRDLLVLNRFQTSTVLMRAEAFRRLGGFLPELDGAEDWDLWLRAAALGPIVKLDAPLVVYRDESAGYSKNLERVYRRMLVMLDREAAAGRLPARQFARIRAWHHLRFSVGFALLGDRPAALGALADLARGGLLRQTPAAAVRYLAPFLAGRVRRRLPG